MKLRELKPGTEFILVRTGQRYRKKINQNGNKLGFIACTRVISTKQSASIDINGQCLVEIASNDDE